MLSSLTTTTKQQQQQQQQRKSLLFGSSNNKRNNKSLLLFLDNNNNNNNNNLNFKKAVQVLVALVLISLFGSNLLLLVRLKKKSGRHSSNNTQYPPPPPSAATAVLASSRSNSIRSNQQHEKQQVGIIQRPPPKQPSSSSSSVSNCKLRQYPPHRYYKLPLVDQNQNQNQQPDFLIGTNVEYIFGEWPIVLKTSNSNSEAQQQKICIHQDEWRNPTTAQQSQLPLLPFADGTNPSILSIERIRKEGNNRDNNSLLSILQAYPNAKYIATACMTNTQCSWNDSDLDKQKFRIPDQTEPDVVLTVLLVLDDHFQTLAQSQLLLQRDATWGINKRKRLQANNKLHRPQLDDARLFIYDGQVWLSYREGGLFGYETQVLNPLHYDVVITNKNKGDDELGSVNSKMNSNNNKQEFRAWLKASETTSFCCGRNMALMELPAAAISKSKSNNNNKLQSLTWVDPVTVIDVDTTPFHVKGDDTNNNKKGQRHHRRKLLSSTVQDDDEKAIPASTTTTITNDEELDTNIRLKKNRQPRLLLLNHHHRRRLLQQQTKKQKKKKSHVHGTNGFMVYLPDGGGVFLGVAHIHRPHDRGANPYARHGHHYTHAFFTISASEPYHLRSLSQEFLLPSISNPNDGEIIQFLSGLEIVYDDNNSQKNGRIVIAYGINDCEAAVTTVSLSYVLEKLLRPVDAGKEVVDYMEPLHKK